VKPAGGEGKGVDDRGGCHRSTLYINV
jgi:hypothetical protein